MVSTDEIAEPEVPVARHWHRPAHYSEPYAEFGVSWVVPYCECGEPLTPRRASAVRKATG